VFGGVVPENRSRAAMDREQTVRESVGEMIKIGEVDIG
jgi:hypothetical protein